VNAQDEDLDQSEYSLIMRGYELSEYDTPMIRFLLEYDEFKKKHPAETFVLDQKTSITIGNITYYCFFGSMDEPNITVIAHVFDAISNRKEYYKINKNNEAPNLWLPIDSNDDGVIDEDEGRWAWY
jgi:hypothetical protein